MLVLPSCHRRLAMLPFALCVEALGSGASWCPQFHNGAAISVSNSCPVAGPLSSAATSQSPELGDLLIQPIAFFLRRRWPGLAVAKRLVHLSTHP
jgi:hypothetical protein